MYVLYFNIPWIIDEADYNCSSRTPAEWKARGSVNEIQGAYFLTSGIIFVVGVSTISYGTAKAWFCKYKEGDFDLSDKSRSGQLTFYSLSLIGMARGKLLRIPCYRLMFFNGIIDIMSLFVGSFAVPYLLFTGGVFCTNVVFNLFIGHLNWSLWIGSTINCVVLAFNRMVEMIPSMKPLRFLFRGKTIYMWIIMSIGLMIVRPFVLRPVLYNSYVSAFLSGPSISDDMAWEVDHYISVLLPLHNSAVIFALVVPYTFLCYKVFKMSQTDDRRLDKVQLQIFVQVLVICSSTVITALVYIFVEFFPVPKAVVVLANVVWQFSHGSHGLVYIFLNKRIRAEVLRILCLGKSGVFVNPNVTKTMTINPKN